MSFSVLPPRSDDFSASRELVLGGNFFQYGVGSLSEQSQHAILKNYYCPNPSSQEINIGPFVADIADETGITEIQTRNFGSMRKKLDFFLKNYPVRLVYPRASIKWLVQINPETGEILSRRRSPKKDGMLELFRELYSIQSLLWDANFSITIPLMECEEYRIAKPDAKPFHKKYENYKLLPLSLLGESVISCPQDLLNLLPETLPPQFTSADLKKYAKTTDRLSFYTISVLRSLGLIEQIGKKGRAFLYQISEKAL